MRMGKCQCSIFMDNYGDFIEGKVDFETKSWMEQHKKECIYCKKWSESFRVKSEHSKEIEAEENAESKRKTNVALVAGIAVVLFITFWMATWFS